jgi:hypothetical protein
MAANAQAGLDPCWSQTQYVGFVVMRLKLYLDKNKIVTKSYHVDLILRILAEKIQYAFYLYA